MTREDQDHLKILSILFYVFGGLQAFFGCILVLYFLLFGTVLFSAASQVKGPGGPPPAIGGIFIVFAAVSGLFTFAMAGCVAYVGKCLTERKYYIFCMVIAALICTSIPLGTVLGVFTIIVLVRPTVKAAFQGGGEIPGTARVVEQNPFSDEAPPPPPDQGHYR